MGAKERIKEIEEEIARTQKNKATEAHLGGLRARLSKLRLEESLPKGQPVKGKGWEVSKSGDARACLIGFPSVGKSTFISLVTNTFSKQAEHEFTTVDCIAGVMEIKGASVQILDLPGIIDGAASNKGRGRQILSIAKTSDVIIMMLDYDRPHDKAILTKELHNMGIRINRTKPKITLDTKRKNSINKGTEVNSTVRLTKISEDTVHSVLKAYKLSNSTVTIREDITVEDLIDVLAGNVVYTPCVFVYNKVDELTIDELESLPKDSSFISCTQEWNIEGFKEDIWNVLNFIRIYTKRKGEKPDFIEPVVMRKERRIDYPTVKDLCKTVHKNFHLNFKFAFVYGTSVKHQPQKVGLNHVLEDEDVIQIYTSR